jgi:hypothetical protein
LYLSIIHKMHIRENEVTCFECRTSGYIREIKKKVFLVPKTCQSQFMNYHYTVKNNKKNNGFTTLHDTARQCSKKLQNLSEQNLLDFRPPRASASSHLQNFGREFSPRSAFFCIFQKYPILDTKNSKKGFLD